MQKRKRKSTLPAIIPNQPDTPVRWYFRSGDGAKQIAESQKNERNKMNLIRKAEQPGRSLSLSKGKQPTKPIIRAKTRVIIYKSVRTINN